MAIYYSNNAASQQGLTLCLDGANPKSTARLGSNQWLDISPQTTRLVATMSNVGTTQANGGGLTFNGSNSYADLNSQTIITGLNPFSIEAAYTVVQNGGGAIFGTYGSGYVSNTVWFSGLYGLYINAACYVPGLPLASGNYHMVATRNGSGSAEIWLNGTLSNTASLPASVSALVNFRIGTDTNSAGGAGPEQFSGTLYQLRVYNRVLTASEIQQNFQSVRWRLNL